jgi:L-threonylcarbamoyladenylate synthase
LVLQTVVVQLDPEAPAPELVAQAAQVLRQGGIVAFPTETFYGLGADAWQPAAVRRVFAVKGRPESKPVLVLVSSVSMAESLVQEIPSQARRLMDRYWPGPLTLVFRAHPEIPLEVTAGTGTIGLRVPGNRIARELVQAAQTPVTAPSANPSGATPPVRADQVLEVFAGRIDMVLDGGRTAGGPPSTVVDVTAEPFKLVRPGAVRF